MHLYLYIYPFMSPQSTLETWHARDASLAASQLDR